MRPATTAVPTLNSVEAAAVAIAATAKPLRSFGGCGAYAGTAVQGVAAPVPGCCQCVMGSPSAGVVLRGGARQTCGGATG